LSGAIFPAWKAVKQDVIQALAKNNKEFLQSACQRPGLLGQSERSSRACPSLGFSNGILYAVSAAAQVTKVKVATFRMPADEFAR
jgi:hypothetical protein